MRYLLAIALTIFTSLATQAQGPWVASSTLDSGAGGGFPGVSSLMVASPQVVWGARMAGRGMGVTENYIFCSTDGGQVFQQQLVVDPIVDVWGLDGSKAWATTALGRLISTTTGPAGFSSVTTAPNATLRYVRFLDTTTGILIAQPATGGTVWPLFLTNDGGLTWTAATAPVAMAGDTPINCTQVGNAFWVSTSQGYVLRSTNGGQSWASAATGMGNDLREVAFRDALNGLAFGKTGQVRRTTDGGQNWTAITPLGPLGRSTAVAIEGSAGTYLSGSGSISPASVGTSISNDNGAPWVGLEACLYSLKMAAKGASSVYAGSINVVYRYGTPLAIAAKSQPTSALCYPNPASDILYVPAAPNSCTAQLYDVTGRPQRTWELKAGGSKLSLLGIADGIYQLHLVQQDQSTRVQRILVQH